MRVLHLPLLGVGPGVVQTPQAIPETESILIDVTQSAEVGRECRLPVPHARQQTGLPHAATELRPSQNRRDGFGPPAGGRRGEVRESAARADPDASVGIGEEAVGVAILPNQPVSLSVVIPSTIVQYVQAGIGPGPQPAALVEAERVYLDRKSTRLNSSHLVI